MTTTIAPAVSIPAGSARPRLVLRRIDGAAAPARPVALAWRPSASASASVSELPPARPRLVLRLVDGAAAVAPPAACGLGAASTAPSRSGSAIVASRLVARAIGGLALGSASLLFALLVLGPRVVPYGTLTVLSSSMRPAVNAGDVVVTRPVPAGSVRVGDIITYRVPVGDRHVVTHRVVEIVEPGPHPAVRTMGDASGAPDPWVARLQDDVAWRMQARIPYLGWVLQAAQAPQTRWLVSVLSPALLAVLAMFELWPRRWRGVGSWLARRVPAHRFVAAATVLVVVAGSATAAFAAWSDPDTATTSYSSATLAPPTAPATAAGTCSVVEGDRTIVSWTGTASTWADGYEIARSTSSGGPYSVIGTVAGQSATSYTDGPLPFSTTYYYVVRATKVNWRSADTAEVSRTTKSSVCV